MLDINPSIDATFEANIIPNYDVNLSEFEINYLWDINPDNGTTILFENQDSVSYEFTIPDVYSLTYSFAIGGDQCSYDASYEFNVGVINLYIFTVVMLLNIDVSALLIASVNLECLKTPVKFSRVSLL